MPPILTIAQPGANEITVVGVTPTADEHSIKVEGTGSAIITDITVELLPNRDIFQEIYPDSDSDSEKDESEDDDDDEERVNDALEEVREKLVGLVDEQKRSREVISSAESRLKILDAYGKSLDKKRGVDITAGVETYRAEREKVFQDHMQGTARDRELAKEIARLRREEQRLLKLDAKEAEKAAKAKAKVKKAKVKLQEKQRRRDAERLKEKARIRKEREQFWPRFCYSVRITLDATNFTPGSSRRSSVASLTDVKVISEKESAPAAEAVSLTCDLCLSYVTSSAFWSPSYDLALSTTTNTATLCFDARLTNMTSETWTNSKVILSTSQANFSGLKDDIPSLVPWRLKLAGRGGPWDGFDIVHSREERAEKDMYNATQNTLGQQKPRAQLFGVGESSVPINMMKGSAQQVQGAFAAYAPAPALPSQQADVPGLAAGNLPAQGMPFQTYPCRGLFCNHTGHGGTGPKPSLFGNIASTAPTGTLFGGSVSNANTAPGGSLFATNINTASAGLFGSNARTAPTGALFGGSVSNANTVPSGGLFGSNASTAPAGTLFGTSASNANTAPSTSPFGSSTANAAPSRPPFGSSTSNSNPEPTGGHSGASAAADGEAELTAQVSAFARSAKRNTAIQLPTLNKSGKPTPSGSLNARQGAADYYGRRSIDEDGEEDEGDGQTMLEPTPEVTFQDSSFEETGLTATYDLPNLKTLKPSSTASKQRVARISFANVVFSRTVVAKYKPAAYLRARLRNTSKLTLLRGPTGLTLDGTFMGRSTLPRCSAGDSFSMALGVDPAIKVAYPKPDVTRSTTGVFSKGENSVYTRSITLVNTRATAGKPVGITVLDQVPVSEDEKLRVDVLHPAGLARGGAVPTGVPGKDGKDEKEWGRATATLKKAGEVSWDVVLNAGKSVKLVLQYEVAFPTGERVTQC